MCVGPLANHLPKRTGLTVDFFINNTTAYPYFNPFLTKERQNTFLEYMQFDTKWNVFPLQLFT